MGDWASPPSCGPAPSPVLPLSPATPAPLPPPTFPQSPPLPPPHPVPPALSPSPPGHPRHRRLPRPRPAGTRAGTPGTTFLAGRETGGATGNPTGALGRGGRKGRGPLSSTESWKSIELWPSQTQRCSLIASRPRGVSPFFRRSWNLSPNRPDLPPCIAPNGTFHPVYSLCAATLGAVLVLLHFRTQVA